MPLSAIDAVGALSSAVMSPALSPDTPAVTGGAQLPVQGAGYLADSLGSTQAVSQSDSVFAATLTDAVTGLQSKQDVSSDLGLRAVSGGLDDIHDYTIAATEAKVALELTVAMRNKAVEAFNEIMRMQA